MLLKESSLTVKIEESNENGPSNDLGKEILDALMIYECLWVDTSIQMISFHY